MEGAKMNKDSYEIRSVSGNLRADSAGKLAGYAILYNSLSQDLGGFVERVVPGALKRSLAQPDNIRAYVEHDPHKLLARVGSRTLELREQNKGIYFELSLPDVSYARDLGVLVQRGDIAGVSFGFRVNPGGEAWEMRDGQLTRDLTDIDLREISIVSDPAYTDTTVAVRSKAEWQKEQNLSRPLFIDLNEALWMRTV
jgi:HK97 family phage prohead protease